MSLKELLSNDCGQLNPVLRVASHFAGNSSSGDGSSIAPVHLHGRATQEHAASLEEIRSGHGGALLPPTTFRMDSLLKEIQSLDRSQGLAQAPRVVDLTRSEDWVKEFQSNDFPHNPTLDQHWADEYRSLNGTLDLDRAWEEPMVPPQVHQPHFSQRPYADNSLESAKDILQDSRWANEYTEESKTELMTTAEEFLNSINDPTIRATEFMSYVEKLSTGEVKVGESSRSGDTAENWTEELINQSVPPEEVWTQEYAKLTNAVPVDGDSETMTPNERQEFWQKLQTEWEKAAEETGLHPWLSDSSQQFEQVCKIHRSEAYRFEEENPYRDFDDPLEEGRKRLLESDIPAAALLFEAACQKQPDNPEAWYLLGTTQALNEQDPLAISALSKCLEIQPNNLKAIMAMAASLTNETYNLQACRMLKRWLKENPKYSDLVPGDIEKTSNSSSILPSNELGNVQNLYMRAARKSPANNLDPDVQCGLGVLFNLSSDYDKAADCFQAAVSADPEDALLWNRLGATLANGGKSAEAIGAYSKALEIIPGFIRTRYNLGIACVNLGAYTEAAEHFLSALNMQASSKSRVSLANNAKNNMSDSIWTSLRMVLHLLDKGKLSSAVDRRDLEVLNQEFRVS